MAKPKDPEQVNEVDPMVAMENRILALEQALANHLGYHFGGIKSN